MTLDMRFGLWKDKAMLTPAVYGARGARPYGYRISDRSLLRGLLDVPGIAPVPGGVACAHDIAWLVASVRGVPPPPVPPDPVLTGIGRYMSLGFTERTAVRPLQKDTIRFLIRNAGALCAEPLRSGKTTMALGAAVAIGAEKNLFVVPAIAKWHWARSIADQLRVPALILEGLGASEGRTFCLTCSGRGYVTSENAITDDTDDVMDCPACVARNGQSYGYKLHDIPLMMADVTDGSMCRLPPTLRCPKHPSVTYPASAQCPACKQELIAALLSAECVVCNYELLVPHEHHTEEGRAYIRLDQQGWGPTLWQIPWHVAILDEVHCLRGGISTNTSRRGRSRREMTRALLSRTPRVWGLTGTPFWGRTRDIWGQLDTITHGLFGEGDLYVPGREFMVRYCGGGLTPEGYWKADGRTVFADTELVRRLEYVKIQRGEELWFKDAPPIRRIIIELDVGGSRRLAARSEAAMADAIRSVSRAKFELILETLLTEIAEGHRIVVYVFHVDSAGFVFETLERTIQQRRYKTRMEQVNARCWLVTGEKPTSVKARDAMALAFVEHHGAGAFVATIDAFQVALSLRGARSVHFVDWHWTPSAMHQAAKRAFDPNIALTIVHYTARNSVDDYMQMIVLPKLETRAVLEKDTTSNDMLDALSRRTESKETRDEIWARHTRHLALDPTKETED